MEEVVEKTNESFKFFPGMEYSQGIPQQFREGFNNLRRGLEESTIAKSIQQALLDEFVFVTTRSSILSRLKKPFKLFEKFGAFPLISLEKRAPEEWKETIRGIKKAVKVVSLVASLVSFSILLGPVVGPVLGPTVSGVRLLLVDP